LAESRLKEVFVRLNKYLAAAGVASRRKCDELIQAGLIRINGKSGDFTGIQVDPEKDLIEYKGARIKQPEQKKYIIINKPSGYVSTCADDKGRDTVMDIIKGYPYRLFPVGRLDFDTEGLLILTNDGDLAYRLTHPKHDIEKKYFAKINGNLTPEKIDLLENGVILDGKPAKSKITVLRANERRAELHITILEGRNRQIRRMMEAAVLQVEYLKRISVGSLLLNELKPGEYREMTKKEYDDLKKMAGCM
jgi:pseudouridine synthase